jgi:hypothetical protein
VLVPGVGLLPALVCNAPAGIVFIAAPAVPLVTFTITVQPPAGIFVPLTIVKLPAPAVAVTPVHEPVFPLVLIVMPAGKVSVNALVKVIALAFVLPIVTVRFVFPPEARSEVPKLFVTLGAFKTVKVAFAVPPVSATGPVAVTAFVVFKAAPVVLLVTFISTAQLAPTARLATFKRALLSPAVDAVPVVVVTVPHATGVKVKVVFARVTPAGKVSGNCTPVNAPGLVFGFITVKVKTLVPPDAIVVGLKLFVTIGGM